MLGRVVMQRARSALFAHAKRRGHHDVPANPGPNCNYDMMPIPNQPYQKVYGELQSKFNAYLAGSLVLLTASIGSAIYTNLWITEQLAPPLSWRQRK